VIAVWTERWQRIRENRPTWRRPALVTAVIVVDAALIVVALGHVRSQNFDSLPLHAGWWNPPSSAAGGAVAGPASAGGVRANGAAPRALPMSVLTATTAARARDRGSCTKGGAAVQLTSNGGRTWRNLKTPVRMVLRLRWTGARSGWLVGANADCRPVMFRTIDTGRTWSRERSTRGAWHLLADPRVRRLHAPYRDVASPCAARVGLVDLAPVSLSTAVALCADGRTYRTTDGGGRWQRRGDVRNALAIGFGTDAAGFAVVPGGGRCIGLQVLASADAGRTWRPSGCVPGARGPVVGLDFADPVNGIFATGSTVYRTKNRGVTWSSA
jgi:photosystem II stability/assembly factor-like uncharacterized protein